MNQAETNTNQKLSSATMPFADDQLLEKLRDQLGLSMPTSDLRICREHYQTILCRVPKTSELHLLDKLTQARRNLPQNLCLAEMETQNQTVAEIFSDLMARRREAVGPISHPLSLSELAETAEAYLMATEKQPSPLTFASVFFTEHRRLLLESSGDLFTASTGTDESDVSIALKRTTAKRNSVLKKGDAIYAILSFNNDVDDFEKKLTDFLATPSIKKSIFNVQPVLNAGLLENLIYMARGLALSLGAFRDTETLSLEDLATPVLGVLFSVPANQSAEIPAFAQSMELQMARIATVIEGNEIKIPQSNGETLTFCTDFLRHITSRHTCNVPVELPENQDFTIQASRVGTCTLGNKRHAVVKVDSTGENSLCAALYGTLYAFLHCVAAGVPPRSVGLASHVTLPRTSEKLSESLLAILGLYRVQTEFELHGQIPQFSQGENEHPTISSVVLAPLPKNPVPSSAIGGGTNIFYLEPLYDENGLPDFEDLKKMLDYVERLNRDGHVLSALPTNDNLIASLEMLSRNTTVNFVCREEIASRVGGLLIESDINLHGTLIAQTNQPDILD